MEFQVERMKTLAAIVLVVIFVPCMSRAAELNLATLTCAKYENEVLPAAATNPTADSLNTVMWLFGYSVAKSGAHVMYPEALAPFGFALDGECKSNPIESLLDALAIVKPEAKNPMDLTTLECAAFASRHIELARTDPESANTIMMWLFGFSVAKSGGHIFDADLLSSFQAALIADCAKHPNGSLFDALAALKMSKPAKSPPAKPAG
jgi:HdeA/HdeB family